jgi:hypothetical protein
MAEVLPIADKLDPERGEIPAGNPQQTGRTWLLRHHDS